MRDICLLCDILRNKYNEMQAFIFMGVLLMKNASKTCCEALSQLASPDLFRDLTCSSSAALV